MLRDAYVKVTTPLPEGHPAKVTPRHVENVMRNCIGMSDYVARYFVLALRQIGKDMEKLKKTTMADVKQLDTKHLMDRQRKETQKIKQRKTRKKR